LIAIPGDSRLTLADGRWRIEARHLAGGTIPFVLAAGGDVDAAVIGNSTLAGRADVPATSVASMLRLLRAIGAAEPPADLVSAGTASAAVQLGGRLTNPEITAALAARDLKGSQLSAPAIDAMVAGQPSTSRLTFSVLVPEATIAGQPLRNGRTTGSLRGDD